MQRSARKLWLLVGGHPWYVGGIALILVGSLIGSRFIFGAKTPDAATDSNIAHVTVATVGDLAQQTGPLAVVGTVTSLDQATILAQSAGEVTSLRRSIGDRVVAGEIIGSFENSSQRAAVTQAEGAYESAQAALAKAQGTTAANSGLSSSQAQSSAQNSAVALATALNSTYAALDDAVHTKADALFVNPRSSTPTLIGVLIPNSRLANALQAERISVEAVLGKASSAANNTSNLGASTQTLLESAKETQVFLGDLITAFTIAIPDSNYTATTIGGYQTSLAQARSEVNSAISALTTAKNAYDAAVSGAQSASNTANGGTQNDIAAAQASLKTALGSLNAAKAVLEKTIIRSPITGTIVSLPITRGGYVSSFSQVAVVSNPGALYVELQVTQDEARTLAVGNKTTVNGALSGIITFVAPALDPTTGKIQVKVGLTGDTSTLAAGQAVTLSLSRSVNAATQKTLKQITIPIVAAKILPTGPVVFTMSASSTLVAQPVVLGAILGDQVVVTSSLPLDLPIVADARGLSAGQTVVVETATTTR